MTSHERLQVQSELYGEDAFRRVEVTGNGNSLVLLKFATKTDEKNVRYDEDGDIVIPRKQNLLLEFSETTTIDLVGLQLWRGAFLLSDFILSEHSHLFENKVILELASGIGLTSIVAGMVGKRVISTDVNQKDVLDLLSRNIERNNDIVKAQMTIEALNFYQTDWSVEMKCMLNETDIVIAADVVYDDELTEAFVLCLTKILLEPPQKIFFLALEKRYVFTLADLNSVPPCYDHFITFLHETWKPSPMSNWRVEFVDTDFYQSFDYDRTEQLVLLKIST
ncbi:methyltransferase-like protein 22 [Cimex lectularius]|uniref:Methyltransferase-like protein 22 n=1 Tax=Cimex lectularius TaxID=79782 RepID=A0A8I6RH64_CIMLE|nr:methyltransferase-like protein 22 [Cimex lectularius]XP_014245290.1 methyltransferase-like protein 22 [Cimex lectularius]XP_014245292.1 methyltransferase-like protein 22 [Cimex lectularius]XP_024082303.1 methyltransferase-like protein 22 [Cimex lectularius]XP_024082304.1 methyltransferase-like protein 22 [Cimex lectularius]